MENKKLITLVFGTSLILVLIVSLLLAGACAPAAPEAKGPIKIGALVPITGGLAHYGPHSIGGINVRLDEAGWKFKDRPIEVIFEDDASFDEVMALQKARKLVELDKVDVLFGPIASSSFLGTETYIDVVKIPTLAIGYRGELVEWDKPGWDFATRGSLAQQTYQAGKFAYERGFRTCNTFGADYETGYQGCGAFVDGFKSAGGTVVQMEWLGFGIADWGPYLAALPDADCTAVIHYGAEMISFVKQWHEFGLWNKQPLITLDTSTVSEPVLNDFGDWALGLLAATDYHWSLNNPINNKFVPAFEAKTGMKPDTTSDDAYTATSFFLAMLEKTGGNTTNEALREALFGLKIDAPAGTCTFDGEKGYTIKNTLVVEVQKIGGKLQYVVLKEYPNTTNPGYYTKP